MSPQVFQRDVQVVQLTGRHLEKGKCAARFEMNADHRSLLCGIDHEEAGMGAAYECSWEPLTFVEILTVVNPRFVFFEIDDQFNGSVRHEAFFFVRPGGIAIIKPEEINKTAERRLRNVGEKLHATEPRGR